ncbi:MAG: hypothetical protein ACI85O_003929 [Saprospiraceae bacterium]|jgi:hypothetical protein
MLHKSKTYKMRLNICLIFFCFYSSMSFGQELSSNDVAYIDTKEKAVYELELPNKNIVGKRLISLDFKNDGLHLEYKDGSKHVALLDIFTERFCWD